MGCFERDVSTHRIFLVSNRGDRDFELTCLFRAYQGGGRGGFHDNRNGRSNHDERDRRNEGRPSRRDDRSRSPRDARPYEERRRFNENQRKDYTEKRGHVNSSESRTLAAIRIILGHWLDIEYEGYQDGPRPPSWRIHNNVLNAYRKAFELPVSYTKIFEHKAANESTAAYMEPSWKKPKAVLHAFWRRYGEVAAPTLNFFLQEEEEAPEWSENPISQWMVDEGLVSEPHHTQRQVSVPALPLPAAPVPMLGPRTALPHIAPPQIQADHRSREEVEDSTAEDEEDEDSSVLGSRIAFPHIAPSQVQADHRSREEVEDSTAEVEEEVENSAAEDEDESEFEGFLNDPRNSDSDSDSDRDVDQLRLFDYSDATEYGDENDNNQWSELGPTRKRHLPQYRDRKKLPRMQLREQLHAWHANTSSTKTYDNLYVEESTPSLVFICSRVSGDTAPQREMSRRNENVLFPQTKNLVMNHLLPHLKPMEVINMIAHGQQATRKWCYSRAAENTPRGLLKSERFKKASHGWGHANIRFLDHLYALVQAGGHTVYMVMHGSDGWGVVFEEYEKLAAKFPSLRFILVFGLMPNNISFDRTGWSPQLQDRFWGFVDLHKMVRVAHDEEVDQMYKLMLDDLRADTTQRNGRNRSEKHNRNYVSGGRTNPPRVVKR